MIELKVEEYCHDCPEFEAVCNKALAYDNQAAYTVITCENAGKCSRIRRYLSDGYNEPKPELTTAGPIKSYQLCADCYYGLFANGGCNKLRFSVGLEDTEPCVDCPNHVGGEDNCACVTIEMGKPCPYYKHYKEAKND